MWLPLIKVNINAFDSSVHLCRIRNTPWQWRTLRLLSQNMGSMLKNHIILHKNVFLESLFFHFTVVSLLNLHFFLLWCFSTSNNIFSPIIMYFSFIISKKDMFSVNYELSFIQSIKVTKTWFSHFWQMLQVLIYFFYLVHSRFFFCTLCDFFFVLLNKFILSHTASFIWKIMQINRKFWNIAYSTGFSEVPYNFK